MNQGRPDEFNMQRMYRHRLDVFNKTKGSQLCKIIYSKNDKNARLPTDEGVTSQTATNLLLLIVCDVIIRH
jgi:hypothetical protein